MRNLIAMSPPWAVLVIAASAVWPTSVTRADEKTSPAAPVQAGGTAPAGQLVAQALEAETRADLPRRVELLKQAVRAAPDFAPARWQSGQVRYGQDWVSVDAAIGQATHDELLGEYRELRAQHGDNKEEQLVLARWCQKHHLLNEMRAHATRLLDLSPNDPEAIQLLGLSWHQGLLLTPAQLAQRKAEAERAKATLKVWQPRLMELRRQLESSSPGDRDAALEKLGEIRDPNAIEALEVVFKGRPAVAREIVRVIGQMPGRKATDVLLRRAVLSKQEDVRLAACEQLRARRLHSYVPTLMGALSTPLQTSFEVARDADGLHFRQTTRREGATTVVEKSQEADVTLLVPNVNLGAIIGEVYEETFLNAKHALQTTAMINRKVAEFNSAIYWVLDHTTGSNLPPEPQAWWDWWQKYNELSDNPKETVATTYVEVVDVPYVPYIPQIFAPLSLQAHGACFAKGTKVWTLTGPLAIDEVRVGDRVLAQDPLSGELDYKPVLRTTNGHQPMIAIDVEGEQIVATKGHVFWVSGVGWRMAKNLQVGDRLHTVSGWTEIKALKDVAPNETHNLVVADFGTFFVGDSQIYVHDISIMQPNAALVPGQGER